jgi:hypothetical protein
MITKTNTNTSTTGFSSDNPSISQPGEKWTEANLADPLNPCVGKM